MAIIRVNEIREMDGATVSRRVDELRSELRSERAIVNAGGRATNPGRIREIRKTIARLLTIAREKKITLAMPSGEAPAPSKKKEEKKEAKKAKKTGGEK